MSTPCRILRSHAAKSSPASSTDTEPESGDRLVVTLSWLKGCVRGRSDPNVFIYFPEGTNDAQRNFFLTYFIYFSRFSESTGDHFAEADAYEVQTVSGNYNELNPFVLGYKGAKSMWRFIRYMQGRRDQLWAPFQPIAYLAVGAAHNYGVVI